MFCPQTLREYYVTPLRLNHRLILASRSPRRRELLQQAGYQFEVVPADEAAEGGICGGEPPRDYVARLAGQKARDVSTKVQEGLIVAGDTVAELDGRVFGKPRDENHAREMLRAMRGRRHYVHSGLCVWRCPDGRQETHVETTTLIMDAIADNALEAYLHTDGWVGKAGAFGYQDGLDWVHIIEGSASNVVGLPMELLATMLAPYVAE